MRGEERRALLVRLAQLDTELVTLLRSSVPGEIVESARRTALNDLASFRATMAPEAFERAVERATTHALRDLVGLPVVAFS